MKNFILRFRLAISRCTWCSCKIPNTDLSNSISGRQRKSELTAAERQQRIQAQLKALKAVEAGRKDAAGEEKAKKI